MENRNWINYLELNGITYQCPASFTGTCTALYEFDRNVPYYRLSSLNRLTNYNQYCA